MQAHKISWHYAQSYVRKKSQCLYLIHGKVS